MGTLVWINRILRGMMGAGAAAQMLSVDDRHRLKLLWTHEPAQPDSPASQSGLGSSTPYSSLWDRPAASAPQHPAFGAYAALPSAELAITLDPRAVTLSSAHGGRVLVVEQQLSGHKSRHRGHNEGGFCRPLVSCMLLRIKDLSAMCSTQIAPTGSSLANTLSRPLKDEVSPYDAEVCSDFLERK
jgi:hypothetical protein